VLQELAVTGLRQMCDARKHTGEGLVGEGLARRCEDWQRGLPVQMLVENA
jgi:hypothetical protein